MAGPVHIDTDGGVDDALAMVMLARAGAQIASVGSVAGVTRADIAAANASLVLRQSGCGADVLVGASRALIRPYVADPGRGHGHDGLNGQGGSFRRVHAPLQRPHGMSRLTFAARQKTQGLFLGPLTNLASALLDDPAAFRNWRPIVTAGAFEVPAPDLDGADFNTWSDPEALQRVLGNGVNPRLVPLDITSQVLLPRAAFEAAAEASDWPLLKRLWRAVQLYMDLHAVRWGGEGCRPHDAVAAATLLWPDLFRFEAAALRLDEDRRGIIVRLADAPPNAEVCVAIDAPEVERRLVTALFGDG